MQATAVMSRQFVPQRNGHLHRRATVGQNHSNASVRVRFEDVVATVALVFLVAIVLALVWEAVVV
jgi:hypothetical protein